ncbi:hypothetical protein [Cohnella abietis]|uniref:Uncharacterized protein n=1 Tax=Cohnella abietis TaxID=2507935 RepID=A0A3T1CZN3_9BACL|nr:hypothetical protein [Cohnella abietis]BBI31327.1 hypothetical protein KCTCHS21_07260 [Cohnella abietis]
MSQASRIWADLIIWAGYMQLGVVVGSLAIPYLLQWRQELSSIRPLIRQVFWTYAAYILCTNLFMAILSIFLAPKLVDGSELSNAICIFITLYWGARIGIQFFYFDKKGLPSSGIYRYGEWLLILCFAFFTIVYGRVALISIWGMS